MTQETEALEVFGRFLMKNVRDRSIDHYDKIAIGQQQAPALQEMQMWLNKLSDKEKSNLRNCVLYMIDGTIAELLFNIEEQANFQHEIEVVVNEVNIETASDGLSGELYSKEGWIAKFSKHPELNL